MNITSSGVITPHLTFAAVDSIKLLILKVKAVASITRQPAVPLFPDCGAPHIGETSKMALIEFWRCIPVFAAIVLQFPIVAAPESQFDFPQSELSVTEGATSQIIVRRTGDTSGPAEVTISLNSGEAPRFPVTLQFAPSDAQKSFTLSTTDNPIPEADRFLELSLTNVTGATLSANSTLRVRVMDDDGRPGDVQSRRPASWQIDESLVRAWTNSSDAITISALLPRPDGGSYVVARKANWSQFIAFDNEGGIDPNVRSFSAFSTFKLAAQSDGKILLAGELRVMDGHPVFSLARYTPTGQFDESFVNGGYSAHGVYALAVQPDDKILIGGILTEYQTSAKVVRLLKNGAVDRTFHVGSEKGYYCTEIAVQPDGKVLFAYQRTGTWIERVNADGTDDPTFTPVRTTFINNANPRALAVQPDGKVLTAFGTDFRRVTSSGEPDPDFKLLTPPDGAVSAIIILPDQKILVAGSFKNIGGFERRGLARFNTDGSVDTTFDPGPGANFSHAVLLNDGNYLAAGDFQSYNTLPIKNLVKIRASVSPRFVLWKKQDQIETWFTANPGATISVDQSSNLQEWQPLETLSLSNFSTKLTPNSSSPLFLRAKLQ